MQAEQTSINVIVIMIDKNDMQTNFSLIYKRTDQSSTTVHTALHFVCRQPGSDADPVCVFCIEILWEDTLLSIGVRVIALACAYADAIRMKEGTLLK